jgi:hypothetical protein
MSKWWRPLNQEQIAGLVGGDPLLIRQNYLYNPDRLPVTYTEAVFVTRSKREVTLVLKCSDTATCVGLTEGFR